MAYYMPRTLSEALPLLAGGARAVAGGTDVFPAAGRGLPGGSFVDLTRIEGLCGIVRGPDGWRIGAATTWSALLAADLPPLFDGLKAAAREVGGVQVQNAGTIAGNICNASPAADGVPPLLAMAAEVEIEGASGSRRLPLGDFILGPRRTALSAGELVTALHVPDTGEARSAFVKLGARRYLVISIAMAAAVLRPRGDVIEEARVAVGSCGPAATRLTALERDLKGVPMAEAGERVSAAHLDTLTPIDDIRASAVYRRDAAREIVTRALAQAGGAI